MNVAKAKKELRVRYPGVVIKENKNRDGKTVEIIGEIDKSLVDSEREVDIAVIDRSPEHYHKVTVEEYEVIKGDLMVYLDDEPHELRTGDRLAVSPGVRHRAVGKETWIYCYSEPAWSADDYHLV